MNNDYKTVLKSPIFKLSYKITSPTKAVLKLESKEVKAENKRVQVDFMDMLAPESDYLTSFLRCVLAYEKGYEFAFSEVECVPHYENKFVFYPASAEYLIPLVHGLEELGLFLVDEIELSFCMVEHYHDKFYPSNRY